MNKEIKHIICLILAAIGFAMGVAVIVLTTINSDVTTKDLIRMLGVAAVSLGAFALNSNSKG